MGSFLLEQIILPGLMDSGGNRQFIKKEKVSPEHGSKLVVQEELRLEFLDPQCQVPL